MKSISAIQAVFAGLLALAARTPAAPIGPVPPGASSHTLTIRYESYGLRSLGWGIPHARQHHRPGRPFSLRPDGLGAVGIPHGSGDDLWGDFRFHPPLCGGSPGVGLVRFEPEGPALNDADDEDEPGDEDTGEPVIAIAWNDGGIPAPEIPAVPEPGSLALMGAGMLGLAAAGAFRRKRR